MNSMTLGEIIEKNSLHGFSILCINQGHSHLYQCIDGDGAIVEPMPVPEIDVDKMMSELDGDDNYAAQKYQYKSVKSEATGELFIYPVGGW